MEVENAAFSFWGKLKPYKSLFHHMLDAGLCAEAYLKYGNKSLVKTLSEVTNINYEEIIHIVGYCVACHDIGKAHPYFQLKSDLLAWIPEEHRKIINSDSQKGYFHRGFRHEKYSVKVLERIWKKKKYDEEVIDEITSVIADHHQKRGKVDIIPKQERDCYEKAQDILETEISNVFKPKLENFECYDWSVFCEALNGILVLADWIASNNAFMNEGWDSNSIEEYSRSATIKAEKTVKSIGFISCRTPYEEHLYELFHWEKEYMRPMQALTDSIAREEKPRLVILEDSPGSGKTETAVYLALSMAKQFDKTGLYFALPTAATANQMWERLNAIFSQYQLPNFRLLHGMAWSLVEDSAFDKQIVGSEDEIGTEWLRPTRKALLSQYAVGTVDQIMMAVLNVKFRQLRMLGLTDKVLIIDEVHAYDSYMSTILDRLLEWCGSMNIPVVLLSATLPAQKKQDYISAYTGLIFESKEEQYPLLSYCNGRNSIVEKTCDSGRHRKYKVKTLPYLNETISMVKVAIELVKDGGNLCLMVNTVKDAQKVYELLKNHLKDNEEIQLLLYHARYKTKDRVRIEKECLERYSGQGKRPTKSILVCTQVVEQSLDVDFDILMTQICPVDLLVQRMGREWRHNLNRPRHISEPVVYVITGDITKSPMRNVYSPYIIRKTNEYLQKREYICVPEDLRQAIAYVYDYQEDGSQDFYENYFNDEIKNRAAEGVEIGAPDKEEYFLVENDPFINEDAGENLNVTTRLGKKSTRIVLCTKEMKDQYKKNIFNRELQNEMLMNSLSIPEDIPFEECEESGVLKGLFIVTEENGIYQIRDNLSITYNEELGAIIERR